MSIQPEYLMRAFCDYGVAVLSGCAKNPRITQYWQTFGLSWPNDDNPSWCGAALSTWVDESGLPYPAEGYYPDKWVDWGVAASYAGEPGSIAVVKGTNVHLGIVAGYSPAGARPWLNGAGVCLIGGAQQIGGSGPKQVCIGEWRPITDFKAWRLPA